MIVMIIIVTKCNNVDAEIRCIGIESKMDCKNIGLINNTLIVSVWKRYISVRTK